MAKTFAERARALKKKYKRADYDEVEKKELIEELRKLRKEQEEFRADAGMEEGEDTEEFAFGGLDFTSKTLSNVGFGSAGPQFQQPETSILPSAISTGFSLLGNIVGGISANKQANSPGVTLGRVAPEQISLENEREALRRSYGTASNISLANSRNMSSPGAAYANQVAGLSSMTDSLGAGMNQSYMNEANTNAQFRQQASATNADIASREAMYNSQRKDGLKQQAAGYRDAAFQAIRQGMQDYRAQKSQDALLSSLGKDYGIYEQINPNETPKEKLMRQLFGPNYSVQNREYVNSLKH